MDENTKQSPVSSPEEQEIDLLELAGKVWAERRLVLKWCGVAVVVALVVGFSIPKEYTTTVMLAPEVEGGSRSLSGLSALAGMAGINMNAGESSDALYPELYPDIVSSVGFTTELFPVPVEDEEGESHALPPSCLAKRIRPFTGPDPLSFLYSPAADPS